MRPRLSFIALLALAACAPPVPADTDAGQDTGLDAGCPLHFHACGNVCRYNDDPSNCGDRCTPCPVPENGTATCDNETCGITCDPDYHACGDSCVLISGESCGDTCQQCPTADNATPYCSGTGDCRLSCDDTYTTCPSGTCGRPLWATEHCTSDSECCDGHCQSGVCCASLGAVCETNAQCASNLCTDAVAMKCGEMTDAGTGVCCFGGGHSCTSPSDCCSGTCISNLCSGG